MVLCMFMYICIVNVGVQKQMHTLCGCNASLRCLFGPWEMWLLRGHWNNYYLSYFTNICPVEVYIQFLIFGLLCEDHREMFDVVKKLPYLNKMYTAFQNRENNCIQIV